MINDKGLIDESRRITFHNNIPQRVDLRRLMKRLRGCAVLHDGVEKYIDDVILKNGEGTIFSHSWDYTINTFAFEFHDGTGTRDASTVLFLTNDENDDTETVIQRLNSVRNDILIQDRAESVKSTIPKDLYFKPDYGNDLDKWLKRDDGIGYASALIPNIKHENIVTDAMSYLYSKTSDENIKDRLINRVVEYSAFDGSPSVRTVISNVFVTRRTVNQDPIVNNSVNFAVKFDLTFALAGVRDLVSGKNVGLRIEVDGDLITVDDFIKYQL